jgi:hypothetical protein
MQDKPVGKRRTFPCALCGAKGILGFSVLFPALDYDIEYQEYSG